MAKFNMMEGQFDQLGSYEEEKRDILVSWLADNYLADDLRSNYSGGWAEINESIGYDENSDIFELPDGSKFRVNLRDESVEQVS